MVKVDSLLILIWTSLQYSWGLERSFHYVMERRNLKLEREQVLGQDRFQFSKVGTLASVHLRLHLENLVLILMEDL
jgi:hypothetical protein